MCPVPISPQDRDNPSNLLTFLNAIHSHVHITGVPRRQDLGLWANHFFFGSEFPT